MHTEERARGTDENANANIIESAASGELKYKAAYLRLFNRISDMIEQLKEMQCEAEEMCISEDSDKAE